MSTNDAPIRWGIIGTAKINGKLLAGAKASGVAVTAVSSRDAAKAQAYAAEVGVARAHGSYEALLADPEVDAVYISLPNHLHHPWTMKALAAGKHVLCEKPYTRRPAEVDEAWDAADAAGLVLQEAFMWRHSPADREAAGAAAGDRAADRDPGHVRVSPCRTPRTCAWAPSSTVAR